MSKLIIDGVEYNVEGQNISINNGDVFVDGKKITENKDLKRNEIVVRWEGPLANLTCDRSVNCDDIAGNLAAGGSVNCDDVGGNLLAGGSVNCDDVGGEVKASGSVNQVGGRVF